MEMNRTYLSNESIKASSPHLDDIVFVAFLFIIFLLAEGGNISVFVALLKQKIRGPTVLLFKALIVSTSLTGILYIFPACLTSLVSDWPHNRTLCTIQAFLKNCFVSWTSFLLALLSIERTLTKTAVNRSRSNDFYVKILLGMLVLSGLLQCVSFVSHHRYVFIPEMMSCDYQTGIGSINYLLITSIIPCIVSLLLMFKDLCCTFNESNRVSPRGQRISFAFNHSVARPNLIQMRDVNKKVKRNLTILQMVIASMITISSCLRIISVTTIGYSIYMKTILWLINLSGFLLPVFCITMRKSLQRSFFMSDRQSIYSRASNAIQTPHLPPRARQDCKNTREVPFFLKKKHSDIDISLQYAFNPDFNGNHCSQPEQLTPPDLSAKTNQCSQSEDCNQTNHCCTQRKQKMSELSLISCDIQIDNINNSKPYERLSLNSCSGSVDSVFVRVNTPLDKRSISITSRRESPSLLSSPDATCHLSTGSEESGTHRNSLPPVNFTITTNVNGREVEQRRVSSSNKYSFSRRVSELPLLTPVEDVGSLECSPRVSIESKKSSNCAHTPRLSQLKSRLQKLNE